ncbi:MAG TPA: PDZ domain-containing protein [Gemmatimonadaceae bacterium]
MKYSGGAIALALACALTPAGSAFAQQAPPATAPKARTRICVNDRCMNDTTRVLVVNLISRLDSLQRVFLGSPISPEEQARLSDEMSTMMSRLADIQRSTWELNLQRATESSPQAMAFDQGRDWQLGTQLHIPSDVAPKGWIGVDFMGAPVTDVHDGEFYVRYLYYPEVESVEPDSPAEHAGIARGDLLLAFNGQDVTSTPISMTRLLQPDRKVVLRLQRDGEPHDYALVVAKAPQTYTIRMSDIARVAPEAPVVAGMPSPAAAPTRAVIVTGTPVAPGRPRVAFFGFDSDMSPVDGATMKTLSPDLGRAVGVDKGVLVLDAPPGSPAADAGLKAGDVIVKAAGAAVASVGELRRTLERHAGESAVELQIVRERKTRTVKLAND